jgi:hypothetical protein
MTVCWHADGMIRRDHECYDTVLDRMLFVYGRCRSGRRWFWAGECNDWRGDGDEITMHGWAETEEEALQEARAAIERAAGGRPAIAYVRQGVAVRLLKSVNAAKRRARPPSGERDARPVEYLYEPWSWTDYDYDGKTHKGINEIPIVKKTAKRIYYDNTSRWDAEDGVVTLGFIDRAGFENDTTCRASCPVDTPVTRCSRHGRSRPHCVHVDAFHGRRRALYEAHRATCSADCALDVQAVECREHGYTWEHCPHRQSVGGGYHGSPAGQARLPGRSSWAERGGTVYAAREAAEAHLYAWEREQERKRPEREAEIKRLRMEMADAHPDRGGTNEGFRAARERYEMALAALEKVA